MKQRNRFTGWTDVDLSEKGKEEGREAGLVLNRSWRLNERRSGALQRLNKAETAAKFGEPEKGSSVLLGAGGKQEENIHN